MCFERETVDRITPKTVRSEKKNVLVHEHTRDSGESIVSIAKDRVSLIGYCSYCPFEQ